MREDFAAEARWRFGGIVFGIELHLLDGPNTLSNAANDDLGKELELLVTAMPRTDRSYQSEEDLNRDKRKKGQTNVSLVDSNFYSQGPSC